VAMPVAPAMAAMFPVTAPVGKRRGGQGCGGDQHGDFPGKHVRLSFIS
jgi:hypothetical protein